MCSLADCFIITLFLNTGWYAMLVNISNSFDDIYRSVEVVCIVSIIFDVVYILFHHTVIHSASRNSDKARGSIRVGDKI
jgi:uncharacterized membrane protein